MSVVETTIEGQAIRFCVANPNDAIMKSHQAGAFYEAEELAWIKQHYRSGTFLDIGANVGNHAIYVSKFLNAPRVVVFEASESTITILKQNLELNRCENVDPQFLGMALGARDGWLKEQRPEADNWGYTFFVEGGHVPMVTGDSVLKHDEPIGFIKLDVEGMEVDVLNGLKRTIKRWRPTILIEIWDWKTPQFIRWLTDERYELIDELRRYDLMWNYLIKPRIA